MIGVEINGRVIKLHTPFSMKDRCMAVNGGVWSRATATWNYPLTPATANSIFCLFNGELPPDICEKLDVARSVFATGQAIKAYSPDTVPDIPICKTPPWHHQKIAYHFASSILFNPAGIGGGVLLGLDMGCGKSYCAIAVVANHQQELRRILVTCPHSVVDVWPKEFQKHSDLDPLIVSLDEGTVLQKQRIAYNAAKQAESQHRTLVVVINYESLWREPFASWILDTDVPFDLAILDELHRIKAPGGKTSKFCDKLGRVVPYRLGLTGTPIPHSPLDVYGQYRFLDPGIFGTSFGRFRSEYALMGGFQNHQVLQYKNLDDLSAKMYSIGFRVKSEDVFDLPPFQDITREFTLDPHDMAMYRELDEEFCVVANDVMVAADNALVKMLRLQEFTSGFLEKMPVNLGKQKLLDDVLEDFAVEEPIIVFAKFTNDLTAIRKVAEGQGRRYAELSGNINELSKWQDGRADVLGVQIRSGREGVDFTRARYCIYYSIGSSLGDYLQSRKRVDRPGQTREGVYIHLIAKGTVDVKVMRALEKGEEIVESVLNQYREKEAA